MENQDIFPVGKLPAELLDKLLSQAPIRDSRVLVGPGIGLDCAVVDFDTKLLVFKSDPITFATQEIGWYAVQVNANDIATTGATPRWLLATLLLPENQTTGTLVAQISQQLFAACEEIGVSVIGGHTEITFGLSRPILSVTMIGEVERSQLITPRGAQTGDRILLTKGVPIEATSILARQLATELTGTPCPEAITPEELAQAQDFLFHPGISVLPEAQIAIRAGDVHAMHDPTEGGLYTALWELARASNRSLWIEPNAVSIPLVSKKICNKLGIDPLAAIASGALLIVVPQQDAVPICTALQQNHIACSDIGEVLSPGDPPTVWHGTGSTRKQLPYPTRDEIARLFETGNP